MVQKISVSAINSVGAGSKVIITVAGGVDIISDEACVMPVYALNGALIKVVEVEAGTQFVSLNAGTYVINRTVVIVK